MVYNYFVKIIGINDNESGQRLDRFLRKYLNNAPLSRIYKAIRKDIKINGKRCKEDYILQVGDEMSLFISDDELASLTKEKPRNRAKRQFTIVYEDAHIIAVSKPFGLLTHGDSFEKKNHLANQVVDYLIEKGDYDPRVEKSFTPAPVNRLDRNTTGIVLFGKNAQSLRELNKHIRERGSIEKFYMTIVKGELREKLHLQDFMVKDREKNLASIVSEKQAARMGGKALSMETFVEPVESCNGYTLVKVQIVTGRTHQIRLHMSKAGYPVIGDVKYGDKKVNQFVSRKFSLNTQLLHAYELKFLIEDGTLSYMNCKVLTCELPEEFQRIYRGLLREKDGKRIQNREQI